MTRKTNTRRELGLGMFASFIAGFCPTITAGALESSDTVSKGPSRREVIKQELPGHFRRTLTLTEIVYPPSAGSPPHVHANGVMAFVVSGSIASRVENGPERIFHAGEAWWEPPGAVHRVSRNASSTEEARLLAIYIAPLGAMELDLMRPL